MVLRIHLSPTCCCDITTITEPQTPPFSFMKWPCMNHLGVISTNSAQASSCLLLFQCKRAGNICCINFSYPYLSYTFILLINLLHTVKHMYLTKSCIFCKFTEEPLPSTFLQSLMKTSHSAQTI